MVQIKLGKFRFCVDWCPNLSIASEVFGVGVETLLICLNNLGSI